MPTFEDLVGNRESPFTTLAYWIGSLKPDAPVKNLDPAHPGYAQAACIPNGSPPDFSE